MAAEEKYIKVYIWDKHGKAPGHVSLEIFGAQNLHSEVSVYCSLFPELKLGRRELLEVRPACFPAKLYTDMLLEGPSFVRCTLNPPGCNCPGEGYSIYELPVEPRNSFTIDSLERAEKKGNDRSEVQIDDKKKSYFWIKPKDPDHTFVLKSFNVVAMLYKFYELKIVIENWWLPGGKDIHRPKNTSLAYENCASFVLELLKAGGLKTIMSKQREGSSSSSNSFDSASFVTPAAIRALMKKVKQVEEADEKESRDREEKIKSEIIARGKFSIKYRLKEESLERKVCSSNFSEAPNKLIPAEQKPKIVSLTYLFEMSELYFSDTSTLFFEELNQCMTLQMQKLALLVNELIWLENLILDKNELNDNLLCSFVEALQTKDHFLNLSSRHNILRYVEESENQSDRKDNLFQLCKQKNIRLNLDFNFLRFYSRENLYFDLYFKHGEVESQRVPALLKEGFSVTWERGIVYIIRENECFHVTLAFEYLEEECQRHYIELELLAHHAMSGPIDLLRTIPEFGVDQVQEYSAFPFGHKRKRAQSEVIAFYATREQINRLSKDCKEDMEKEEKPSYQSYRAVMPGKGQVNCARWVVHKVNRLLSLGEWRPLPFSGLGDWYAPYIFTPERVNKTHDEALKENSAAILQFEEGYYLEDCKNYSKAIEFYKKATDQGHAEAQYRLGLMYQQGLGVRTNLEEVVSWYTKAAEQGHPEASYRLGLMYQQGLGVRTNLEEAVSWYTKAAEQEHAEALLELKILAKKGHAKARYSLGVMYQQGLGVGIDLEQALSWYTRATNKGHVEAQYSLGVMYELGKGCQKCTLTAKKHYEAAAKEGHAGAKWSLSLLTLQQKQRKNDGVPPQTVALNLEALKKPVGFRKKLEESEENFIVEYLEKDFLSMRDSLLRAEGGGLHFILGSAGVGKSTIVNYTLGHQFVKKEKFSYKINGKIYTQQIVANEKEVKDGVSILKMVAREKRNNRENNARIYEDIEVADTSRVHARMGDSIMCGVTQHPEFFFLEARSGDNQGSVLVDFPGFMDANTNNKIAFTLFMLKEVIEASRSRLASFIITFSHEEVGGVRGQHFLTLIQKLQHVFDMKKFIKSKESIIFVDNLKENPLSDEDKIFDLESRFLHEIDEIKESFREKKETVNKIYSQMSREETTGEGEKQSKLEHLMKVLDPESHREISEELVAQKMEELNSAAEFVDFISVETTSYFVNPFTDMYVRENGKLEPLEVNKFSERLCSTSSYVDSDILRCRSADVFFKRINQYASSYYEQLKSHIKKRNDISSQILSHQKLINDLKNLSGNDDDRIQKIERKKWELKAKWDNLRKREEELDVFRNKMVTIQEHEMPVASRFFLWSDRRTSGGISLPKDTYFLEAAVFCGDEQIVQVSGGEEFNSSNHHPLESLHRVPAESSAEGAKKYSSVTLSLLVNDDLSAKKMYVVLRGPRYYSPSFHAEISKREERVGTATRMVEELQREIEGLEKNLNMRDVKIRNENLKSLCKEVDELKIVECTSQKEVDTSKDEYIHLYKMLLPFYELLFKRSKNVTREANNQRELECCLKTISFLFENIKKLWPEFYSDLRFELPELMKSFGSNIEVEQCVSELPKNETDDVGENPTSNPQKFKHIIPPLKRTTKKGIEEDIENGSEDEQVKLAKMLSLDESKPEFDMSDNRFTKDLKLSCENVLGDGWCFFRAIAKQIEDRKLNNSRAMPLPTTLEGILRIVETYFNEHTQELMDRVFPPPIRNDFGTGEDSEKSFQKRSGEYNNEFREESEAFEKDFREYIYFGKYNSGGESVNAADWMPQIISDILQINVDIYDAGGAERGFHSNNISSQRIGLGRVNNNHYISLNGDLDAAWQAEIEPTLPESRRGRLSSNPCAFLSSSRSSSPSASQRDNSDPVTCPGILKPN